MTRSKKYDPASLLELSPIMLVCKLQTRCKDKTGESEEKELGLLVFSGGTYVFSQKEVRKDTEFPKGQVIPPATKSTQIQLIYEKFHTCTPTDSLLGGLYLGGCCRQAWEGFWEGLS